MIVAAVVVGNIANHVKEHTIKGIAVDCLTEDFEKILLLIAAVNTRVHLPIVVDILAFDAFIQPLGLLGSELLIDFTEIKPANNTNPFAMQPLDNITYQISGESRIAVLVRQFGGIVGDNAADVEQDHVGLAAFYLLYVGIDIQCGIDLT